MSEGSSAVASAGRRSRRGPRAVGEADQPDLGAQRHAGGLGHHGADLVDDRRTSSAEPPGSAWMKLACLGETSAVPIRKPFNPQASISRPAESPGGLVNTDPALLPARLVGPPPADDLVDGRRPSAGSPGPSR